MPEIQGVELRSEGDDLIVSVYRDGKYFECFREHRYGPMNHMIHEAGLKQVLGNN